MNGQDRRVKDRQKVIVVAGPTASGKTSLGVDLALSLGGEVVNADSMQVYRGMDVGTAKPTMEERKGIAHHLLDVVDPDEEFNAATFCFIARPIINDIGARGKICLVVGGTGLYIKSLLGGLLDCPPVDQELRDLLARECETQGSRVLHERLNRLDPESAGRIHPNDGVRITRALEILHLTRRRPSELTREHSFGDRPLRALKICLDVERERLYQRINERSAAMVKDGLIEETRNLLDKGYSEDLKPMKAIGYSHVIKYLKGDWSLDESVLGIQRDTRRYAKRQLTWFRADLEVTWIAPDEREQILERIRDFLTGSTGI
jgi:tRNA dimethylallyltransferase